MRETGPVTQQEYLLSPGCTLVTTTDLKSRISYCNPAFIEASGYAKDELIGQPHNMIRHPDMPAEAFRDMWETVQSGLLTRAPGQLKVNLQALVGDVREQVEGIEVASREISAGSIDLSSRTESQAANLQQTAASLEQISGNVQNNSRSAQAASALAEEASQLAAQANDTVAAAIARMEEIRKASARIAEITQVVDALSFQANLLALNAAVEAARAGEQGRGFAVVAGEVRSLASRTRDASKEIKQLIEASVAQVEQGALIVQATGRSVGETRSTIAKLSGLVGEISLASQEQAQGVEQVHQAVNELDALTQQNAAMVEQLSASAASLSSQAGVVSAAVKIFRA